MHIKTDNFLSKILVLHTLVSGFYLINKLRLLIVKTQNQNPHTLMKSNFSPTRFQSLWRITWTRSRAMEVEEHMTSLNKPCYKHAGNNGQSAVLEPPFAYLCLESHARFPQYKIIQLVVHSGSSKRTGHYQHLGVQNTTHHEDSKRRWSLQTLLSSHHYQQHLLCQGEICNLNLSLKLQDLQRHWHKKMMQFQNQ